MIDSTHYSLFTTQFLNKTKGIPLNRIAGLCVSILLLWLLWRQSGARLDSLRHVNWWNSDTRIFGIVALLLLPLNIFLESRKWQMLIKSIAPLSIMQSAGSVCTGIVCSLVTPNRIGEYPGRMLFLKKKFSPRMVSVSVLGGCAQLIAVLFGGFAGGLNYCLHQRGFMYWGLWLINVLVLALVGTFYFSYERWSPLIERVRWLRRFGRYGALLQNISARVQWRVLALSLLRYAVFTTQYYLALRWLGVEIPLLAGLALCALFFWCMAVVPTISLAEAGVRAAVSWELFHTYNANTGMIVAATMALWLVNLLLPSLVGALLMLRVRFINKS